MPDLTVMPAALESSKAQLTTLWEALVPDAVRCVRKNLKETVGTVDSNLVCSFFNVMDALLLPFQRSAQLPVQIVLYVAHVYHLQCNLGNDMLSCFAMTALLLQLLRHYEAVRTSREAFIKMMLCTAIWEHIMWCVLVQERG